MSQSARPASRPLIRGKTIEAVADWMASSCTVASIASLCRDAGLTRAATLSAPSGGQRRSELALHLQELDLTKVHDARKVLVLIESALVEIDERLVELRDSSAIAARQDAEAQTGFRAAILRQLERDGYAYVAGRVRAKRDGGALTTIATHAALVDGHYLRLQVDRLHTAVDDDPWLAIGTAKELVETVCKTILVDRGSDIDTGWDVGELVKAARKELQLVPEAVPDGHRAAKTSKKLLNNLATIVQGLAELRNAFGTGHGAEARAKGLEPRHARLAVGAAATLATFLLETHLTRTSPLESAASTPGSAVVEIATQE